MTTKTVWRCTYCGSDNVAFDAWWYPNTDFTQVLDAGFCMECQGECSIEAHEEEVQDENV